MNTVLVSSRICASPWSTQFPYHVLYEEMSLLTHMTLLHRFTAIWGLILYCSDAQKIFKIKKKLRD